MASNVETVIRAVVTKGIEKVANFNRARMDETRAHPFLTGIHTPMTEERTLTDLAVTGTIPPELSGRYVRIGPNPFKPDPRGHHWFIGDGMVHGVRIEGGKALWYRNRYIRSQMLEAKGGPAAAPTPAGSPAALAPGPPAAGAADQGGFIARRQRRRPPRGRNPFRGRTGDARLRQRPPHPPPQMIVLPNRPPGNIGRSHALQQQPHHQLQFHPLHRHQK